MKCLNSIRLLFYLEHDMTPEKKQHRQAKYREELQAQMKEKEMQKKRYVLHGNIMQAIYI